ncbi:DoxX family membrane protein [Streptomyces sp. BPSDS2]|uniref:DoxX family protein n=1 Tax=Streptomyces sp. BPSDS2 TaxID=2571021 RepID=UPI0010BF9BFF|nr:DoxX family membrane protein [Streptomyces sp. BPSDS2]
MEPLIALVGTTCLALIVGACGVHGLRRLPVALRGGLAVMFLLTGGAHFIGMRDELVAMVPLALPAPGLLVTVTGVAEIAGALALLWRRTTAPAAGLLAFLLIAMFPANVYAADTAETWWDELIPRTLTQLVFLAATATVLVDGIRALRGPSDQLTD